MPPMSSATRSRPRTQICVSVEPQKAVAWCEGGPIFISYSETLFVIRIILNRRSATVKPEACPPPHEARTPSSVLSHTEIDSLSMAARKLPTSRREAMGGLAKGIAVIRAFTREHPAPTLSDIARSAAIPAATARRCLLTLEDLGYITRHGRSFLLRPKVLELGAAYLDSMDIEHLTKNHLEELARKTGDSAAMSVLDGNDIVYVARASVRTLLRLEAHVGSRFPAHATSMGRVLLAGLSRERLQHYFDTARLEALTDKTVCDREALRALI